MLGRVGVKMKIDIVPGPDFFDKYIHVGQFDFTVFSWIGTPFPISSSKSHLHQAEDQCRGRHSTFSRITPAWDPTRSIALFDAAAAELDHAKAIEIANRIDTLIWQEVHSLTLYQRPEIWPCKKGLANIGAVGFAQPVYKDIGWTK